MQLPASVQEIASVIGTERALYLIGQLPRCYTKKSCHVILYVPKHLKPDHQLVRLLGWNDARRLVAEFGGEILQPANCAEIYRQFRDRSILQMLAGGSRPAAVAELMGVSDRHVRNLQRENAQEDNRPANDNTPRTSNHGDRRMQSNTGARRSWA